MKPFSVLVVHWGHWGRAPKPRFSGQGCLPSAGLHTLPPFEVLEAHDLVDSWAYCPLDICPPLGMAPQFSFWELSFRYTQLRV
jgi:hypothetical protein